MINQIGNKNFITLDPYLDISSFLSLENEFNFLISSLWDSIRSGIWNAAGHSPEIIHNKPSVFREKDFLYYAYEKANILRQQDKHLNDHLVFFENSSNKVGLEKYLKLRFNAFDPYYILNLTSINNDTGQYEFLDILENYPNIKNFFYNLPFESLRRITVFYNEHYVPLGHHRDYNYWPLEHGDSSETLPPSNQFIWLRFDLNRSFYLFDVDLENGKIIQKIPIQGHSAIFNDTNWHGNLDFYEKSTLTVKISGIFTEDFTKKLGISNERF